MTTDIFETPATLDEDGASFHHGLAAGLLDALEAVLSRWPDGRAGTRISGDPHLEALLGAAGPVGAQAGAIMGAGVRPVRAVLFDKNGNADWALGWHQDRTIVVRDRIETPGFGPWSIKQGLQHVEPPFHVIESMLTARIHLDPVDGENAPLLVARGSHRLGRIPSDEVADVAARSAILACRAERGDVWLYCTPVVHSSNAAKPGRRRRVLQIDYALGALPEGLEWLGI